MEPFTAIGTAVGLVAQLRGIRDNRKAAKIWEEFREVLQSLEGLPPEVQDLANEVREMVKRTDQDHDRILGVLGEMSARLQAGQPRVELSLACARHFGGREVAPEFYRMMDDPHKRGPGTMRPVGTLFRAHLDLTNRGSQATTVESMEAEVGVAGGTWSLRDRRAGADQIYCMEYNCSPADGALKPGERVTVGPSGVQPVLVCLETKEIVPEGITKIAGRITCADVHGNSASAECTFASMG